jgi:hypothetical protein
MALNTRKDYDDSTDGQGSKNHSLEKASQFVKFIHSLISPLLSECIYYESEKKLGNAPSVELPNGKLAIAPDLRCVTNNGNVFWIEVKDKSQRFYHPDTGADIFQVYGWYNIFKYFSEPVFVLFKDPAFESCLPKSPSKDRLTEFKARWDLFNGETYGGWLSDLLVSDGKYPRVFQEHSRELIMYILYFRVALMTKVSDFNTLISAVDNKSITNVEDEIKAYYHADNSLLTEENIRKLIASLFK